jgi:hypothetical protein
MGGSPFGKIIPSLSIRLNEYFWRMFLRRVFTTGEEPRQTVTVFRSKIAERIQAGEKSRNAPSFSAAEVPAEKEGISLSLRG